jgi:hypothetical protein
MLEVTFKDEYIGDMKWKKLKAIKRRLVLWQKRRKCNHEWEVFHSGWMQCKKCMLIKEKR